MEIRKLQILSYIEGHVAATMSLLGYDEDKAFDMAINKVKTDSQYNKLFWKSALNQVLLELEGDT